MNGDKEIYCQRTMNSINNEIKYDVIVNFLESDYFSPYYKYKNKITPLASNYIFWENVQQNKKIFNHIEEEYTYIFKREADYSLVDSTTRVERVLLKLLSRNSTINHYATRYFLKYVLFRNYISCMSEQKFEDNINWYIALFSKQTKLIFINPPERIKLPPLYNEEQLNIIHERAKLFNDIMRRISTKHENICLLEMGDIINENDIVDTYSHLKRAGYLKLSAELTNIL